MATFKKTERICSKRIIDKLFAGGNPSIAIYPLRAVYMQVDSPTAPVSILISVPKRRFHHAVDRNRMKRQVRETYRLNKHILQPEADNATETNTNNTTQGLAIAFICITDKLCSTQTVSKSVVKLLHRIKEQTAKRTNKPN